MLAALENKDSKARAKRIAKRPAAAVEEQDADETPAKVTKPKATAKESLVAAAKLGKKPSSKKPTWPFPGVPKTNAPARQWGDAKIYTSCSASVWRVLLKGNKLDKAFRWTDCPKRAWSDMLQYLADNA